MSSRRTYVTLLGRSSWALLNAYYAVCREARYFPDEVAVVAEEPFRDQEGPVTGGIRAISEHFGFSPEVGCIPVARGDMVDAFRRVHGLVTARKGEGCEVAIDITPGRKAVVAALLLPVTLRDVDHVFYLEIATTRDAARPYQMIPRQFHRLHDFSAEAREAAHGK
ncbi:MAG: hypothetical protein QFX32_05995 [Methanolinea sp.]|nr:hypothetical protein [Methanolinea sp.]